MNALIYRLINILLNPIKQNKVNIIKKSEPNFWNDNISRCGKSSKYEIYDITNKKLLGDMIITPLEDCVFIDSVSVKDKNKGVGKFLLKKASEESLNLGLNGHLELLASCGYDNQKPPHLYYRKQGFKTLSKIYNLLLDLYIKTGLNLPRFLAFNIKMYR